MALALSTRNLRQLVRRSGSVAIGRKAAGARSIAHPSATADVRSRRPLGENCLEFVARLVPRVMCEVQKKRPIMIVLAA